MSPSGGLSPVMFGTFGRSNSGEPTTRTSARSTGTTHYDELIVVYQASSPVHADEVEAELVTHFHDADNVIASGDGPGGPPPYYVYVIVEH